MSALAYIVTYIPSGRSEPVEDRVPVETGDPDVDADTLIDEYWFKNGDEVIHIRWSTGGTTYAALGIDR